VKQELRHHLIPLLILFVFIFATWLFNQVVYYEFIYLFLAFCLGAFFLDTDHLIYWLYLQPNLEESRLAQAAIKNKDYKSILKLLEITHKNHVSLIFHHYFFQIVLILVSFFVFTSSSSVFTMAFLLALNIHLLVDEFVDFSRDPGHLQSWLFAREKKQLTAKSLQYYLFIFVGLTALFAIFLINSR
jgi:hypothetical protein